VVGFLLLRSMWGDGRLANEPRTVMVLVLNTTSYSQDYIGKITQNRQEYAKAHGYGLFIKHIQDYPGGWASIPAIRHAMSLYKHSDYFWYLDQDAIIMNPSMSLEKHITNPSRLGSIMRRETSIVPPDSIIKTYRHVPPERIQFIISQDAEGLQPGSMIVRSGPWAHYFLDAWYDPIFRFYSWGKAETHALVHIVQWHPTILTKLALVPQRIMNSYSSVSGGEGVYADGDFVIHFHECWKPERNCEKEFNRYWDKRRTL